MKTEELTVTQLNGEKHVFRGVISHGPASDLPGYYVVQQSLERSYIQKDHIFMISVSKEDTLELHSTENLTDEIRNALIESRDITSEGVSLNSIRITDHTLTDK